jgi:hypothetical protein
MLDGTRSKLGHGPEECRLENNFGQPGKYPEKGITTPTGALARQVHNKWDNDVAWIYEASLDATAGALPSGLFVPHSNPPRNDGMSGQSDDPTCQQYRRNAGFPPVCIRS